MEAIDMRRAGALAVAIAALGFAAVQSLGAGVNAGADSGTVSPARALEVQKKLQQARVPQRLEAAMGSGFGGVWYDRAAALLHVGFVSPAGRAAAGAVAAKAGLASAVAPTPVRSSWADLLAGQERMSHRLAGLFSRAEVAVGLVPRRNSVEVELGSAVSPSRLAAVRREGLAALVGVSVEVAPIPHLRIERHVCQAHEPSEANCEPPIVAGMTVQAGTGSVCTAGPAVILQNPTTPAQETETFVLTAGHCIEKSKGVGEKWYAYTPAKPPNPPVKHEIGKAIEMLNGAADVGVIKIEAGSIWQSAGFVPVAPAIAPWKEAKPVPVPVISEAPPVTGFNSCFSGQTSGIECGEVVKTNVEYTWESGKVSKELAEVKGMVDFPGDSGGPFFSEASPNVVEGTDVGTIKTGNVVFQPMSSSLSRLPTEYKLLRTINEERHPFKFVAKGLETKVTSTADGTGKTAHHVIDAAGGTLTCSGATFEGTQAAEMAIELAVSASYKECTYLGQPTTVSMGGCGYVLHSGGEFDIASRAGKNCATEPIKWEVAGCKVEISPQGGRELLTFHNVKPGSVTEITMGLNATGIVYKATGEGCVKKGELSDGAFTTGNTILTGAKAGGGEMIDYGWE